MKDKTRTPEAKAKTLKRKQQREDKYRPAKVYADEVLKTLQTYNRTGGDKVECDL